ncbi:hypothetical protein HPP92_001682 [Vanilla planifolia]|uniref:Uncharacterized protein n=1 Tax=Vanilla planifolia TaxID=51239 RepID=A0A835VLM3_VANPL|nr:hypothetical protein HPP92_001682 [Vanilla planifolia]
MIKNIYKLDLFLFLFNVVIFHIINGIVSTLAIETIFGMFMKMFWYIGNKIDLKEKYLFLTTYANKHVTCIDVLKYN